MWHHKPLFNWTPVEWHLTGANWKAKTFKVCDAFILESNCYGFYLNIFRDENEGSLTKVDMISEWTFEILRILTH